jgi:hypothetical protein
MAVQIYYKFTSACVALAMLQVWDQRINSRTTDFSPLITNIFPKQVLPGPTGLLPIFFFRDWTETDSKFKLQCRDLIACTGCVLAAYVVTNDLACCKSVTRQWCRKIQGQLGIGGFHPIFMICCTGSGVLTTDCVIIARVFSNWHRRIPCS